VSEVIRGTHSRRMEWITCVTCGNRALVRSDSKKLFCSKKCVRGVNKNQRYAWKGEKAGYSGFHRRVYRARGKADHCECCGKTDPGIRYEWANLTGNLGDPADYEAMCVPCHRAYDALCRPTGSAHPNAKLTEEIVGEARKRHAEGASISQLAREYGVAGVTVARAVQRITWAHVR
jgi:hypothetical protein